MVDNEEMTMGPPRPRPRPRTRSSLSPVQRGVTTGSTGPRPRTRSSLSPAQRGVTNGSVASPPPLSSPQPGSSRKRKVTTVSKKTSWVWAHFDDITDEEGKRWSKCKHCEGGRYRCGGKDYGTGNMNYHLRRCSEYLITKSGPGSELDNMGKEMEQVGGDFSQDGCRRALVKFIVKDEQSFRMVEGEGFRAFYSDSLEEPSRKKAKKTKPRVPAPTDSDWENARVLVQFLKVFFEATVEFSASTYVTSNSFLEELSNVRRELDDWQTTHEDPCLRHMGEVMLRKYNLYWGEYKKMNPLLFIAVLLDPREKVNGLYVLVEDLIVHSDPVEKQKLVKSWITVVRKDLDILYAAYKSENTSVESVSTSSESIGESSASQASQGSSSFISKKAKHKANRDARKIQLSTVEDRGKSEMERYFAEPVYTPTKENEDYPFEILIWWKINAARFDILSLIARDVLAIPVSSVASESAFSTGKRILGHFRSSLKPRTVEALILLQNWLRTPIDMDPCSLGAEEEEDTAVESEMFGDLSAYSVIVDED